MLLPKRWAIFLLTSLLVACCAFNNAAAEQIRPTGIATPVEDENASPPKPKTGAKKKSARRATKPEEEAPPLGTLPNGVPITKAHSVMVIDAQTGRTLYEKNREES